jgi:hypothetical protein
MMTPEQRWQRAFHVRLLAAIELLSDRVQGLAVAYKTAALAERVRDGEPEAVRAAVLVDSNEPCDDDFTVHYTELMVDVEAIESTEGRK